jgi:hypothetical protein
MRGNMSTMWKLLGLVALSIVFTWPLADVTNPVLARHDDPLFSVWRLAWVAHQLPRAPLELFNTNIFFPETNTLAYSDAMLLLGVMSAPFMWLGVHPIIVHNGLVIAGFVTAALAMARLVAYFTPDRTAQAIAALVFAFAPYRASHIAHLELLWTAFLPLSLLALYRVVEQPTLRRGITFGAAVGLQGLCSLYYAVFLALWLFPALALAPFHIVTRWSRRHVVAFAGAVATASILLSPYLVPYSHARAALGPRSEHDVVTYSARWSDYLRASPVNRASVLQPRANDDERALFVGAIAAALAGVGVLAVRNRVTASYTVLALIAIDLSLGVNGWLFDPLRKALPMLDGFRAPARFGVLALLAVAVLAGLAVARLLASLTASRRRYAAIALGTAMIAEYWIAPVPSYAAQLRPGAVERFLAAQPPTLIARLPFPEPDRLWGYETVFQYLSIFHWQPMVNGYSGHAPGSYLELTSVLHRFPSEHAVRALQGRGVRLVVFQERYTDPGQFDTFLYACHNQAWFSRVQVLDEVGHGRAAVCWVRPGDDQANSSADRPD